MGFISGAEKLQSAQQIKQWYDGAKSLIGNLKTNKTSLVNQLELMKKNTDYTESDCNEVQSLIDDINLELSNI